ncbi:MAG: hypothetical protein R2695_13260 [Acidimicrobiales bacterium]
MDGSHVAVRIDICQYVSHAPHVVGAVLRSAPGRSLSEDDAEELAALLKAIADPVRLRLLSFIATTDRGRGVRL